jgi:hypothetical protein
VTLSEDTQVLTAEEREVRRKEQRRERNRRYLARHREKLTEYKQRYKKAHPYYGKRSCVDCGRPSASEKQEPRCRLCAASRGCQGSQEASGGNLCIDCGRRCHGQLPAPRCRPCANRYYRGLNNPLYKGGCITREGYRAVSHDGRVQLEHRIVWEAAHGPLAKGWAVHHVNGDRSDNRLENLEAMPAGEHSRLHARRQHGGV